MACHGHAWRMAFSNIILELAANRPTSDTLHSSRGRAHHITGRYSGRSNSLGTNQDECTTSINSELFDGDDSTPGV
eukprot:scaffold241791_cov39-Tisochrysis_lutea.AAC.1